MKGNGKKRLSVPGKLPFIAYLGAEALTPSHGTGMMFRRHFSNYPRGKLVDIYHQALSKKLLFPAIKVDRYDLRYAAWGSPVLNHVNQAVTGSTKVPGRSLIYQHQTFSPFSFDWRSMGGPPDLIYSTCFSYRDFAFLHHVHRNLPQRVPIIQHFLDLDLNNYDNLSRIFQELLPAFAGVWAINESIQRAVSSFSFTKPEIVNALQQPLSPGFRKAYRPFSPGFDAMVIGNIWSGTAFRSLVQIWRECQKKIPALPAVDWAGHPRRLAELKKQGVEFDPKGKQVHDIGLLSQPELTRRLAGADLAIIAFHGAPLDREDYACYSLPSRIGDYCAQGLPLVVISRPGTPPSLLVEKNNLGITLHPAKLAASAKTLRRFLLDLDWRAECGQNARAFAERELNLATYQKVLYPRLAELARFKVPDQKRARREGSARMPGDQRG